MQLLALSRYRSRQALHDRPTDCGRQHCETGRPPCNLGHTGEGGGGRRGEGRGGERGGERRGEEGRGGGRRREGRGGEGRGGERGGEGGEVV